MDIEPSKSVTGTTRQGHTTSRHAGRPFLFAVNISEDMMFITWNGKEIKRSDGHGDGIAPDRKQALPR